MQGHQGCTGHGNEFLKNTDHWKRKWQPTPGCYSCLESTMDSIKRQKDMTPEDEPHPRSEGVHYATGEEWRAITNSSQKE